MDHKTMPAVVVSIGGVSHEPRNGQVRNGLIISLNRNAGIERSPRAYLYHEGVLNPVDINADNVAIHAANIIDEYVSRWERDYRRAA